MKQLQGLRFVYFFQAFIYYPQVSRRLLKAVYSMPIQMQLKSIKINATVEVINNRN